MNLNLFVPRLVPPGPLHGRLSALLLWGVGPERLAAC
jgi:hypothetical protein